jgi:UDP-N-acetylglucosamine 2-epimerase (non-hydrolysing)
LFIHTKVSVIPKKVLGIRKPSDRTEAVESGYSELVGTDKRKIIQAIEITNSDSKIHYQTNPYGKGNAERRIADILRKNF